MTIHPMRPGDPPSPPVAPDRVADGVVEPAAADGAFLAAPPPRRIRRTRPRLVIAALAVALAAGAAGLHWMLPHRVARLVITPTDLTVGLEGPATLDALVRSSVGPRAQGTIATMRVDRGATVATGDVLATLVSEDLRREHDSAVAGEAAARSAVRLARADLDRSTAALTNARAGLERQTALHDRGIATEATRETALATFRQAEADEARSRAAIDQAEAQAAAATAEVAVRRVRLDDATLRAPIDGVVVSRNRWVGDGVGPGTEIVGLADPASIVFSVRLDESAIARIRPGQSAELHLARGDGAAIPARVVTVSRSVDTETREFTVDVKPARLPVNWAIGQRATATIAVATRANVLAVPTAAVDRRDGHPAVWIDNDGRATRRAVELGAIGGARVEVRRGLAAGDAVLLDPRGVFAGMRLAAPETTP